MKRINCVFWSSRQCVDEQILETFSVFVSVPTSVVWRFPHFPNYDKSAALWRGNTGGSQLRGEARLGRLVASLSWPPSLSPSAIPSLASIQTTLLLINRWDSHRDNHQDPTYKSAISVIFLCGFQLEVLIRQVISHRILLNIISRQMIIFPLWVLNTRRKNEECQSQLDSFSLFFTEWAPELFDKIFSLLCG
jgi:hypothetical protein